MKVSLFDFQEDALARLRRLLGRLRTFATIDEPQVISFSAPTGSGKTIILTALFEDIFCGEPDFEAQPDAVILWISDMPELNEQTRLKIETKSDRIRLSQLVTVDSHFNEERLQPGHIYFVNTQKLGSDKILTTEGEGRQHSIWKIFTNTARAAQGRFYVVIDEAHRGMRSDRADKTAQTILQRFLLGSPEHGMCQMPLVLGMSATPQRFEDLLSATTHSVHKVYVSVEDVRKSGLLKDRTVVHYPRAGQPEIAVLEEAARQWQIMTTRWAAYCQREQLPPVLPILVVQVEDGTEHQLTRTDLAQVMATLEDTLGRPLKDTEVVHTFNDAGERPLTGRVVRHVEASRIEEDQDIGIVLFKMSLSTGWDCPRAEVMMSFRSAQDHTYIAQLLGRMVRTPLARRVRTDEALNDVHLLLPRYNRDAVDSIINDLKNVEDVPPSEIGTSRELVTLQRRQGTDAVFEAMKRLETYRVGAVRHQSALRRLMGLGRALTQDRLDDQAQERVRDGIVQKMGEEIQKLCASGQFDERAKAISHVELRTITVEHGTGQTTVEGAYTVEAAEADIDRLFERAGRMLSNGLHTAYWKTHQVRAPEAVKVEVIILADDPESMNALESYAAAAFDGLYRQFKWDVGKLNEQRRNHYDMLRVSAPEPQSILWHLPDSINFRRTAEAPTYDLHLYVEDSGRFGVDLGTWEIEVLAEELRSKKVVAWLRNVPNAPWALELPYRDINSKWTSMFPDLLIVRNTPNGYLFDILEPHDPSRRDNVPKAVGLAEFAEKHNYLFDRVQLIRKLGSGARARYRRLNMGDDAVRRRVLKIKNDHELDDLFNEEGKVGTA